MNRLLIAGVCVSLGAGAALAQQAPPAVGYIIATPQPVQNEQAYVGHIEAVSTVRLQARVTGYLEAQDFIDGAQVTQGQLLYVIEQPPYQAALEQAQATLLQAQAQARFASITLRRAQALLHTSAGTQEAVDNAQANAQASQAAVMSGEAQVQTAQINLGYTEIRAPISGIIGATTVDPGNVVGPNSGVLDTIVSEDPTRVVFALPMADAIQWRGQISDLDVVLELPDGNTYRQSGKVDFIGNQVTPSTDTLTWRATIPNPDHALTDGEFVNVILRERSAKPQIVIPLTALITDQLGDYVLEAGPDNMVTRHNVTLGKIGVTTAPVLAGVSPGDRIITEGIQNVHPGMAVSPYPAKD